MFSIRPNLGSYSVTALLKYFQILVIYHIWLGHSLFNLDIPKTSHLVELVPSPRIWRTNYLSWLLTTYLYDDKLHRQKCVYSHSSVIVVINFIIALIFITDSGRSYSTRKHWRFEHSPRVWAAQNCCPPTPSQTVALTAIWPFLLLSDKTRKIPRRPGPLL